jgi:hypothetical protein
MSLSTVGVKVTVLVTRCRDVAMQRLSIFWYGMAMLIIFYVLGIIKIEPLFRDRTGGDANFITL